MSTDRDKIFSAIRQALDPLPERTAYPQWDRDLPVCKAHTANASLKDLFIEKLKFASGRYAKSIPALLELLKKENCLHGYCDPSLADLFKNLDGIQIETTYDDSRPDDYTFGITRATLAVAESGTIMLKDSTTTSRLGALTPWIHIAVIEENTIIYDLPSAIEQFGDDPSIIWITGPSKTADVEGILIEGVHGPGIQVALIV